ncbi:PAPA-1-like conserved region [Musa troglodytarum]|uniref:PAPA-1-like conserved region n=1 Tax=Musa troglodytarum TaxID=320322 RepID=A0A9E7K1H9_9LILI|nr:PAPA-1-like conserved region [Musa troglodytarum]
MEGFGGPRFVGLDTVVKKRRSARRPRPNAQLTFDACNISPLLSAPSLSNSRNFSADDDGGSETFFRRKEVYLNGPSPRSLAINLAPSRKVTKDGKALQELAIVMQSGSPDTGLGKSGEDFGMDHLGEAHHITSESKLRKVKLKVGGVTRTIHAKSDLQSSSDKSSLAKPLRFLEAPRHHLKLNSQNVFDGYSPIEKGNNFQGDSWMDSSVLNFLHGTKEDFSNKAVQAGLSGKKAEPSSEPTRKSKRVPKRRVFDDVEGDYDIRHTEKLRASKVAADHVAELDESGENGFKRSSISKVSRNRNAAYEVDDEYVLSRSSKEKRKKLRQGRESYDVDYVEEEELGSDVAPDAKRKKQNATLELAADVRTECLTTRQRALQSGKAGNGESLIEFPNGLPPAPSRKQKEKLSEVEIQAKKAEAAQRRKMQVEKQTRESEAAAIRKILGQDKKEEKKQKELEEKAKAAKSVTLQPSTIRWVMGPTGMIVTFADDVGLPSLFSSKPSSYPPPREKCAGPSCTNAYKYRDSKTKLPLCSLQCYRAIQESA